MLRIIKYFIDSCNFFRFTKKTSEHCYWILFIYRLDVNQEYYVWWRIFRLLRLSQLSYQLRNYSYILCEMTHHCKDIFKFIPYKVWRKKNYVSLTSFSWFIRFNMLYFNIFSWFRKEDFIQFFIYLWNLFFVFENHLRVSSFMKFWILLICNSFMILCKNS